VAVACTRYEPAGIGELVKISVGLPLLPNSIDASMSVSWNTRDAGAADGAD
jgi:hypothetical protein